VVSGSDDGSNGVGCGERRDHPSRQASSGSSYLSPSIHIMRVFRRRHMVLRVLFSTDTQLAQYLQTYWFSTAPAATIQQFLVYYPRGLTQGSPYDTGTLYIGQID